MDTNDGKETENKKDAKIKNKDSCPFVFIRG